MNDEVVFIRPIESGDAAAFLSAVLRSAELHRPWVAPAATPEAFGALVGRSKLDTHACMVACREADGAMVGVFNVSNIVRGAFQSAHLGFYAFSPYAGQGYMRHALALTIRYAFEELGLHRLEANIQPGNARSIGLAKACGFEREGFSPAYLFIDGAWRDHERWAIRDERASLLRV